MASNSKRKRNYAKEYLIRIARGLAVGKSRSQARGHARAADLPSNASPQPFKRSEPLEDALKLMKKGVSQKEAAKQAGVSAETLRRFQKANTTSHRKGRRWLISDTRPVSVVMATRGKMRDVTVTHDASSDISRHWIAINLFLETNNPSHLGRFVGKGLRIAAARFIPSRPAPTSCVSSTAPANSRSSTSTARRCSEARRHGPARKIHGPRTGGMARQTRRQDVEIPLGVRELGQRRHSGPSCRSQEIWRSTYRRADQHAPGTDAASDGGAPSRRTPPRKSA